MHLDALDSLATDTGGARGRAGDKTSQRLPCRGAVDRQHVVLEPEHDGHHRLRQDPHVQPGS
jgi:hypothetical protein